MWSIADGQCVFGLSHSLCIVFLFFSFLLFYILLLLSLSLFFSTTAAAAVVAVVVAVATRLLLLLFAVATSLSSNLFAISIVSFAEFSVFLFEFGQLIGHVCICVSPSVW